MPNSGPSGAGDSGPTAGCAPTGSAVLGRGFRPGYRRGGTYAVPVRSRSRGASDTGQPGALGGAFGQLLDARLAAVEVALAAQGRGHHGYAGGDRGEREGQVHAVGERLLDQVREERPAGDVGGLAG